MVSDLKNIIVKLGDDIGRVDISHTAWPASDALASAYEETENDFSSDYLKVQRDLSYIFQGDLDVSEQTFLTEEVLLKWNSGESDYSAASITAYALESFGFDASGETDNALMSGAMMAGILADVEHSHLPYHNNLHFRKVMLHMTRLIKAHNDNHVDYALTLNKQDIAELLAAAAVHDLAHDGKGNGVGDHYQLGKIEKYSSEISVPFLKQAGLSDESLGRIRTMLIGTDASNFFESISPINQIKHIYNDHFGIAEDEEKDEEVIISNELVSLESSGKESLKALMLHEADILNSSGVSLRITQIESDSISCEMGQKKTSFDDTLIFLEHICSGSHSDAFEQIAGGNMSFIKEQILQKINNPETVHSQG